MSKLNDIRARLAHFNTGKYTGSLYDLLDDYIDDVSLLLQLVDAALAYRAAVQVPDGVQAAEQKMFEVLERLEKSL